MSRGQMPFKVAELSDMSGVGLRIQVYDRGWFFPRSIDCADTVNVKVCIKWPKSHYLVSWSSQEYMWVSSDRSGVSPFVF